MAEQPLTVSQDIEAQVDELRSDDLEDVAAGAGGTPLASVTDLVIDPFNPNRLTGAPKIASS